VDKSPSASHTELQTPPYQRVDALALLRRAHTLPHGQQVLADLCDIRLPLMLTRDDCNALGRVIRDAVQDLPLRRSNFTPTKDAP
jgi:hypothetical protein